MKTTKQMNTELQEKFPFLEIISEYTGANNKVRIRCNNCRYEWEAIPRSTLHSKYGCPKCKVNEAKKNKSKSLFLSRMDKSKYTFISYRDWLHVSVQCKKCGYIRTTSSDNIYRYGCPKCGHKNTADCERLTKEEFIERAKKVHNDKYDYSKSNYINNHTKMIITCPEHGDFLQAPNHHLRGEGCPRCAHPYKFYTTEDFIKLSKKVHGDKYDYSKVNYINMKTPVTIICPKHGEFKQLPYVHTLLKCRCPKCSESHGERFVSSVLDKLQILYNREIAIKNPYHDRNFRVDFFIEINNQLYIIEYNGEQHYRPVEKFGGKLQYDKQIERDNDLRKYCNENNIHLLEIKYDRKENEITNDIKKFLSCRIDQK